jgi:hypothetical protein
MATDLNKTAIVVTVLLILGGLIALYMYRAAPGAEVPTTVYIQEERPWWPYTALPLWYGSARGYVPGPRTRPHKPLPPPPGPRPPHLPGPGPRPSPEFPTPALPRPAPLGPQEKPAS